MIRPSRVVGYLWLAALIATVSLQALAQHPAPFTAQIRSVRYMIGSDGQKTVTSITLGTVSRSSAGFTLARHHEIVKGKVMPDDAILTGPDGAVTHIVFGTRQAILLQDGRPGYVSPPSQAHGERRMMNGVSCIVVPFAPTRVCLNGKCTSGPESLKNFGCVSPEYGLMVHSDVLGKPGVVMPQRGNEIIETVEDTYNFKIGEPNPASVKIPDGFTRTRRIFVRPGGH